MAEPKKVNLYNVADLKNATDDFLPVYLTSLPKPYTFRQDWTLTNVRLALGYLAVTIAGILFYADWKLGWDATKPYTLPACIAYFVLNGALTLWIWRVEAGTVFVGRREGGQVLTIKSASKKHTPMYTLNLTYSGPATGAKFLDNESVTGTFTDWFNVHGYLDKKALKRWLAGNIEVIGLADPKSKSAWDEKLEETRVDEEVVSEGAARLTGVEASGAYGSARAKKRAKPKKG